jgi:LPXTG-motif cell wall-anchored protein
MPSAGRLLTLAGAAVVGLVGTAVLSSPAHAGGADSDRHHKATFAVGVACGQDGQYRITWTVTNKGDGKPETDTMEVTNSRPGEVIDSLTGKPIEGQKVAAGATAAFVQVVPGTTKDTVSYWFVPQWLNDPIGSPTPAPLTAQVVLNGDCKPKPACEPGTAGKGDDKSQPTSCPSPSASTRSSASASASAALPKTGSSSGLYGGGAVVLLAAGVGLFLVARRRRLTFEA